MEQRKVYLDSIAEVDDAWLPIVDQLLTRSGLSMADASGNSTPGNMASKSSGDTRNPESMTSAKDTVTQGAPSDSTAQALPDSVTAGRDSQSKNLNATADTPAVSAKVGTSSSLSVNNTLADAAARAGKPDSIRETALAHGVDPAVVAEHTIVKVSRRGPCGVQLALVGANVNSNAIKALVCFEHAI